MAINKLELQWWWCWICFGVGGGFLLEFYSPLFIMELRNTLKIILCHSTRV